MPHEDARMERERVYQYIQEQTDSCSFSNRELLTGGDWNAALHSSDRQTGELNDLDKMHIHKMHSMRMRPVNFDRYCAHTFYGHGDTPHSSRIDDLFTLCTRRWPNICPIKLDTGTTCDHAALLYKILHAQLCMPVPQASGETDGPTRFTEFSADNLLEYKAKIQSELLIQVSTFKNRLSKATSTDIHALAEDGAPTLLHIAHAKLPCREIEGQSATVSVHDMASKLADLLSTCHDIASTIFSKSHGHHSHNRKFVTCPYSHHLSRQQKQQVRRALAENRCIKGKLQQINHALLRLSTGDMDHQDMVLQLEEHIATTYSSNAASKALSHSLHELPVKDKTTQSWLLWRS